MRKGTVAFANFICTFGDRGGLLENWRLVLPAFTTDTFIRKYGNTSYHYFNVEVVPLDNADGTPVIAIAGHFVKNTILSREQIFDPSTGLIRDAQSMKSAPSAFFVLVLNTHRLVYLAETGHAPDLKAFEATAAHFIKRVREKWINDNAKKRVRGESKSDLGKAIPRPTVQVLPLSERDRIEEYIKRFASIRRVQFKLIKPNDETDASEVVASVRSRLGKLKPTQLDINIRNSDGLDRDEAIQVVAETAETGNTDIRLSGEDKEGSHIEGSNDQFALTTELEKPEKTEPGLRAQLYGLYKSFVAAGKITVGQPVSDLKSKLIEIASLL